MRGEGVDKDIMERIKPQILLVTCLQSDFLRSQEDGE